MNYREEIKEGRKRIYNRGFILIFAYILIIFIDSLFINTASLFTKDLIFLALAGQTFYILFHGYGAYKQLLVYKHYEKTQQKLEKILKEENHK